MGARAAAGRRRLHLASGYGLFRRMTGVGAHGEVARPELVLEGSDDDGENWAPLEFRYKPGDVGRAPLLVAPHQPRLDWQMWFAALAPSSNAAPWLYALAFKLLRGSEPAFDLLAPDNSFSAIYPPKRARPTRRPFTRASPRCVYAPLDGGSRRSIANMCQ